MSFFEPKYAKLDLNFPCKPASKLTCPKCGYVSNPDKRLRDVSISHTKNKVTVSSEVMGLDEVLSLPWLPSQKVSIEFPIYETVTFNLRKGHSYVTLGGAYGENAIAIHDITSYPNVLRQGAVYNALASNMKVSRTLKRIFKSINNELPFQKDELTPERYILMTRFIGFDRSFFDAMPYELDSGRVEGSFRSVAKKLHSSERAKKYLRDSALPNIKSIHRIYYSKTGLLFYLPEGEILWDIFKDPNLFCRLMKCDNIFEILPVLHQRPAIACFLYDYCRIKGGTNLIARLTKDWQSIRRYAINYCSMSDRMRMQEQNRWKNKGRNSCQDEIEPCFSHPLCTPNYRIADCVIDGFQFCWLRTNKDYMKAGLDLDNCLSEWSPCDNPVVCVKKNNEAVAAIEVCGQVVVQSQGYSNTPLSQVRGLVEAYKKWMEKYKMREESNCDRYDLDDYMI